MKSAISVRSGVLAVTLAAAGLRVGGAATLEPIVPCSPPCTVGGNIVINNNSDASVTADVTASGFPSNAAASTSVISPKLPVINVAGPLPTPVPNTELDAWELLLADSKRVDLALYLVTPTTLLVVGYTGEQLPDLTEPIPPGDRETIRPSDRAFRVVSGLALLLALGGCGTILFYSWRRRLQGP